MPVYFARIEGRSEVKIGHAAILRSRLATIQSCNPGDVWFSRTFAGNRADEMVLHQRFAHLRLNGEWFAWDDVFNSDLGLIDLGSMGPFPVLIKRPPKSEHTRALHSQTMRASWAERRQRGAA